MPTALGGGGATLTDVIAMCHALGQHCASTAMVFAMHQIQVACIVHHGLEAPWQRAFLEDIARHQLLLASATSEAGIGGNTRTSSCAVEKNGDRCSLKKNAIVISYGASADAILVTSRAHPEAAAADQVLVVVKKGDYALERTSSWDTMGMRGTVSDGHVLTAAFAADHILPLPFADISSRTMLPVAHLTWSAVWLGIASDAVNRARAFVRGEARKMPGSTPPGALRVAEVMSELQLMRANLTDTAQAYVENLSAPDVLTSLTFAIRMNHLKVGSSEMAVQVVNHALLVCGILGYKNDTKFSLGRHLRDAHSAALMVSNDRILGNTAGLLLAVKEEVAL
ncbi:MAG: acyl-CoA/acyl-ACP dehydrogenase [Archangiaceae bacterium]|nr:acyl-CoA/acyl-ACP dehydrogenase [Archangiaceae bacterium]